MKVTKEWHVNITIRGKVGKMKTLIDYAIEKSDYKKIEKLNTLTNPDDFWDKVRQFTKNIHSTHHIRRWEILAELRYYELTGKDLNDRW